MIIAIDFDGTIVDQDHPYSDLKTPLRFVPHAREGLLALKRAGHTLVLWSARAAARLIEDPEADILVRSGVRKLDRKRWTASHAINVGRYHQMLDFVFAELPDVFDAIDDGKGGKPEADLFVDDKALRVGYGTTAVGWYQLAVMYGDPQALLGGPIPSEGHHGRQRERNRDREHDRAEAGGRGAPRSEVR